MNTTVNTIIANERATFSFELYPPRSPASEAALLESLPHLVEAGERGG